MNRRGLRISAAVGAIALSGLAITPAMAAAATSQATAQSLILDIAGNPAVTQEFTATNDGTTEVHNDASTIPNLATVIPGNNTLGIGAAPQYAQANNDGTSFACAGIAGTGGGIATVGDSSCSIDGNPVTLDLGSINLNLTDLLGPGALTGPIGDALSPITLPVGTALDDVVAQLAAGLDGTPLGDIGLSGGLGVLQAVCTANPDHAEGDSNLVNAGTTGGVITASLPGGTDVPLVNLPTDPPVNYHVVSDPTTLTDQLLAPGGAVSTEIDTALGGAISQLDPVLQQLIDPVRQQIVNQILTALQPALSAINDNLLDITLNRQVVGDGGRSIEVTALDLQVLPAAKAISGASLVSGQIGKVTCGPNTRATSNPTEPPAPTQPPGNPTNNVIPTSVDSGLAGDNSKAHIILGATGALMLLAGATGLLGYRRMLQR